MCATVNGLKNSDLNYYFKYIAPSIESDDFDVVTIDVSIDDKIGDTDSKRTDRSFSRYRPLSLQSSTFINLN